MSSAIVAPTAVPLINRLSSGTKMLFIMTVALMPLGLIALFASVQSAKTKQSQHVVEARIVAAAEARQIDLTILRASQHPASRRDQRDRAAEALHRVPRRSAPGDGGGCERGAI